MSEGMVDINIKDIHSCAIEYIIDLIESDMTRNDGNSIRGYHLFQEVLTLKNLLKQELHNSHKNDNSEISFAVVNSNEELDALIKEMRDR